jgi:iron complex outermembrane receptor protein
MPIQDDVRVIARHQQNNDFSTITYTKMKTINRYFLLLLLPLTVVTAQKKTDTVIYRLPETTIIGVPLTNTPLIRFPLTAGVIDNSVISQIPRAFAIDEELKLMPGIKIDNQANGARVHMSIRGQGILTERGIRGIQILLDGIPLNDPTGFAPDFFDVNHSAVERVEVLRGPAASMYGGGASGGVVNITTRNAPNRPLFGEASTVVGSNDYWRGSGMFGGQVDGVNYLFSMSRALGSGYRDHTHFSGNNVLAKATITPAQALTLMPVIMWSDYYHENPEGINLDQYNQDPKQANPDAGPYNEHLANNRLTGGLTGTVAITDQQDLKLVAFTRRTNFREANNHTFNYRQIDNPGVKLAWSLRNGRPADALRNTVTIGADAQWQTINERRVDNLHAFEGTEIRSLEEIDQRAFGAFVLDRVEIGGHLSLLASVRYDGIKNELEDKMKQTIDLSGDADFDKATGQVGVEYFVSDAASIHAGWGQGFLPPATEELAQNPVHYGGFNTDLKPATSNSFELGVRGMLCGMFWYDVTGFHLATDNDFDRYRITDPMRNQETFYRNAAASKRQGLEASLECAPFKGFDVRVAYTWSHFRYSIDEPLRIMMDDTTIHKYIEDGNTLPNSPEHQLYIDAQYEIVKDLVIGIGVETVSKSYIDGANVESEAAKGYTMLHGRIGYTLHIAGMDCAASLNVRNITDEKYVAFTEPDPGGNAYQPGVGREVFFGLKVGL